MTEVETDIYLDAISCEKRIASLFLFIDEHPEIPVDEDVYMISRDLFDKGFELLNKSIALGIESEKWDYI